MKNKLRIALLASTVCVCAINVSFTPTISYAQSAEDEFIKKPDISPDAQMFIQSDELVYDNDKETVAAQGNVQVDYDGYQLIANQIKYNQKTGRLVAAGNVIITEPNGHKVFAESIDITEDFKDGFIDSLRVETPDDTRFSADKAERIAGEKTIFENGVYTACKPCQENPEKPPFWQIRAQKVILDGKTKTVRYENARFELFGKPIAQLPFFQHASPSSKRKSGFLMPSVSYDSTLGLKVGIPYYFALAPSYDLTVTGSGFSRQGFLGEAEWRQRLENGSYTIRAAGIHQLSPDRFSSDSVDSEETNRGMIATTGEFKINPRWTFGWDVMAQSDRTFSETYSLEGYESNTVTSDIYLKGLHNRSYFDLHAYRFQIQDSDKSLQREQALVHPSLDYNLVVDKPVANGQLGLDVNGVSLSRKEADFTLGQVQNGIEGNYNRLSLDLNWKSTYTNQVGMSFTPFLSLRGDAITFDNTGELGATTSANNNFATNDNAFRYMPTAGLEMRWPILATAENSQHVFEPIAQILLRPDLDYTKTLPNEDAQSLVFDATNLFSQSKFSGYDRIESGIRANIGLRYSGTFDNGWNVNALVGQSYHLHGDNPYNNPDLVLGGASNGLETDVSDFVTMLNISAGNGFSLNTRGRFDERILDPRRVEGELAFTGLGFNGGIGYAFIDKSATLQDLRNRHQITARASYNLTEEWRIFGAMAYDINESELISDSIGIEYLMDCFSFNLSFAETHSEYFDDEIDRSIKFKINFRTLGAIEGGSGI